MYISKSQIDKRLYFIEDFGIGNICPTLKDQQISYLQKNYKHLSHLLYLLTSRLEMIYGFNF